MTGGQRFWGWSGVGEGMPKLDKSELISILGGFLRPGGIPVNFM